MISFDPIAAGSRLFQASSNKVSLGFFAFYYPLGTPPAKVDFKASWTVYSGYYLFLGATPGDLSQFEKKLSLRFISNPAKSSITWITWSDSNSEIASSIVLELDASGSLIEKQKISLRNYSLDVEKSSKLMPSIDQTPVSDSQLNSVNSFLLVNPHARRPGSNLTIPLSGDGMGCLESQGIISDFSDDRNSGWDIGCRFFIGAESGDISQRYPIFNLGSKGGNYVLFQMRWDPTEFFDDERTFLAFGGMNLQMYLSPQSEKRIAPLDDGGILHTYFRTRFGQSVVFYPVLSGKHQSKLVFQTGLENKLYLVPQGAFELGVLDANGNLPIAQSEDFDFLCGLAGTEYVSFKSKTKNSKGDLIVFYPDQPAYAPIFPLTSSNNSSTGDLLTKAYTTAWAEIRSNGVVETAYYTQPKGNALYGPTGPTGNSPIQHYFQTPAVKFPDITNSIRKGRFGSNNSLTEDLGIVKRGPVGISHYGAPSSTTTPQYERIKSFGPTGIIGPTAPTGPTGHLGFPMVAYAGMDKQDTISYFQPATSATGATGVSHTLTDFEFYILNPFRRSTIISSGFVGQQRMLYSADEMKSTITPQGLLAKVDTQTSQWTNLLLAKNQVEQKKTQGNPVKTNYTLQFGNLGETLKAAFQVNQQFLVVSTCDELGTLTKQANASAQAYFQNIMSIEGWPFVFDLPPKDEIKAGSYSNILIFKFCKGTVLERVQNNKTWTDAETFNASKSGGIGTLASWLTQYIKQGIESFQVKGDQNFKQFAEIVTDPNWRGVLGLKVNIDVQEFPPQLQGLLAGIDLKRFNAHHFGIQVNHPQQSAKGVLEINPKSSLFGLINYVDNSNWNQASVSNTDYAFKTLILKVLFENSKIQNFVGKIQLTVNSLFGNDVVSVINQGAANATNNIIFNSSFEDHDGYPVYTFTEEGDSKFFIGNSVLNYVEIVQANFTTLLSRNAGPTGSVHQGSLGAGIAGITGPTGPNQMVHSRFSMWGYMCFNPLMGATGSSGASGPTGPEPLLQITDLFSYGTEPANDISVTKTGLSFSNLWINMDFPLLTPSLTNYEFDTKSLVFDPGQSISRRGSLAQKLPIEIIGFTNGDSTNTPSNQGYLLTEVNLSGPGLQMPKQEWYGLIFNLNLGSLGDLVGKASFNGRLLLAWGTDQVVGDSYPAMVGIALPGVDSKGQLLNIEGVLKITLADIKLIYNREEQAYLLKLTNIALKLLGLKIPPSANVDFFVFGDPTGNTKEIGWYGAYQNKSGKTQRKELDEHTPTND